MKNIIFIAPPAAGKGTQAKLVSEEYNIPHISTGDLLREEANKDTPLGRTIKNDMEKGNLVSDEVITTLLKNRITLSDCNNGYILDGYPRNISQAKTYNELLNELNFSLPVVIFFNIDKERALKRTLSRIICPNCGSSYNLLVDELKPKKENICDRCLHELKTRNDDTEEVFNNPIAYGPEKVISTESKDRSYVSYDEYLETIVKILLTISDNTNAVNTILDIMNKEGANLSAKAREDISNAVKSSSSIQNLKDSLKNSMSGRSTGISSMIGNSRTDLIIKTMKEIAAQ